MPKMHTPGPWKLARTTPGMTTGLIGPTPDKRLGTIHTGSHEYVANAHLIAAAPTMLAALKECLGLAKIAETLTGCRSDDDYVDGIKATIERALAAASPSDTE